MADTPDKSAPATDDTSPSPFRRFPYVQLAFCAACLAMTAWTWMRYSYAWDVTTEDIAECNYDGSVWRLRGRPSSDHFFRDRYVCFEGHYYHGGGREGGPYEVVVWDGSGRHWRVLARKLPRAPMGSRVAFRGRLKPMHGMPLCVDGTRSRLHGASVGGLAVGAMGCYIFGLYLRRWLRERKAAA